MVHRALDQPPNIQLYVHRFAGLAAFFAIGLIAALALTGVPSYVLTALFMATVVAGIVLGLALGVRARRNYWRN